MKKLLLTLLLLSFFSAGHGSSYLHRAAYDGDLRKVYLALKRGADLEKRDSKGRSALFHAIYQSSVYRQRQKYRIAAYLIRRGADINQGDYEGRTPLHEAVRYGNRALAMLLISRGADITRRDKMGTTALHNAARRGMTRLAEELIRRGADVNCRDNSGWTPLHEGASKKNDQVVRMLLERGADPRAVTEDGNSPLHLACCEKNILSVIYLLRASKDTVKVKNIFGKTPLFYAVRGGSVPVAALLIEKGAGVNEPDTSGFTPLFYAARDERIKMARLLIRHGASMKHRSLKGETPLHYAARMGNEALINLLLEKGADRKEKNSQGLTYFDILTGSSQLYQYRKCRKKLPRIYVSYMEGKHSATSYSARRPWRHSADKCFDRNMKTCWIEGERGRGIGEKIAFYTDRQIRSIAVFPGHGNRRLFKMHNRLQRAKIYIYENKYRLYCKYKFGDILTTINASFEDLPVKKKFPVKLKKNSPNGYIVVIEIESVYRGTRWKNDTCIAEVETI